jgi:hypothetical protein
VRRDHFDWKIVEGPDDLITQVGRALLGITDWSIAGHAPVGVRPANEGDAEFLELCWCDWEYRPVGVMLSDFGADQRASSEVRSATLLILDCAGRQKLISIGKTRLVVMWKS